MLRPPVILRLMVLRFLDLIVASTCDCLGLPRIESAFTVVLAWLDRCTCVRAIAPSASVVSCPTKAKDLSVALADHCSYKRVVSTQLLKIM